MAAATLPPPTTSAACEAPWGCWTAVGAANQTRNPASARTVLGPTGGGENQQVAQHVASSTKVSFRGCDPQAGTPTHSPGFVGVPAVIAKKCWSSRRHRSEACGSRGRYSGSGSTHAAVMTGRAQVQSWCTPHHWGRCTLPVKQAGPRLPVMASSHDGYVAPGDPRRPCPGWKTCRSAGSRRRGEAVAGVPAVRPDADAAAHQPPAWESTGDASARYGGKPIALADLLQVP